MSEVYRLMDKPGEYSFEQAKEEVLGRFRESVSAQRLTDEQLFARTGVALGDIKMIRRGEKPILLPGEQWDWIIRTVGNSFMDLENRTEFCLQCTREYLDTRSS